MKTTLEIPDPLFRKAKATAAQHGVTLREFVNDALREKLSGDPKAAAEYLLAAYKGGHKDARVDLLTRPEAWSADTRREIQRRLTDAGLYAGRVTGTFDGKTRAAIEAYGRRA